MATIANAFHNVAVGGADGINGTSSRTDVAYASDLGAAAAERNEQQSLEVSGTLLAEDNVTEVQAFPYTGTRSNVIIPASSTNETLTIGLQSSFNSGATTPAVFTFDPDLNDTVFPTSAIVQNQPFTANIGHEAALEEISTAATGLTGSGGETITRVGGTGTFGDIAAVDADFTFRMPDSAWNLSSWTLSQSRSWGITVTGPPDDFSVRNEITSSGTGLGDTLTITPQDIRQRVHDLFNDCADYTATFVGTDGLTTHSAGASGAWGVRVIGPAYDFVNGSTSDDGSGNFIQLGFGWNWSGSWRTTTLTSPFDFWGGNGQITNPEDVWTFTDNVTGQVVSSRDFGTRQTFRSGSSRTRTWFGNTGFSGADAQRTITLDMGTAQNIVTEAALSITTNDGIATEPSLSAENGMSIPVNGTHTTYTVRDAGGTADTVTTFTGSVGSTSDSDFNSVLTTIINAINTTTETPDFSVVDEPSNPSGPRLLLTATVPGPVSNVWNIDVNNNGTTGTPGNITFGVGGGNASVITEGDEGALHTSTVTLTPFGGSPVTHVVEGTKSAVDVASDIAANISIPGWSLQSSGAFIVLEYGTDGTASPGLFTASVANDFTDTLAISSPSTIIQTAIADGQIVGGVYAFPTGRIVDGDYAPANLGNDPDQFIYRAERLVTWGGIFAEPEVANENTADFLDFYEFVRYLGETGTRGAGRWNHRVGTTINRDGNDIPDYTQAELNSFLNQAVPIVLVEPVQGDQLWLYGSLTPTTVVPTAGEQAVYLYSGTQWDLQNEVIDGNLLVTNTVTAYNVAAGTLTSTGVPPTNTAGAYFEGSSGEFVAGNSNNFIRFTGGTLTVAGEIQNLSRSALAAETGGPFFRIRPGGTNDVAAAILEEFPTGSLAGEYIFVLVGSGGGGAAAVSNDSFADAGGSGGSAAGCCIFSFYWDGLTALSCFNAVGGGRSEALNTQGARTAGTNGSASTFTYGTTLIAQANGGAGAPATGGSSVADTPGGTAVFPSQTAVEFLQTYARTGQSTSPVNRGTGGGAVDFFGIIEGTPGNSGHSPYDQGNISVIPQANGDFISGIGFINDDNNRALMGNYGGSSALVSGFASGAQETGPIGGIAVQTSFSTGDDFSARGGILSGGGGCRNISSVSETGATSGAERDNLSAGGTSSEAGDGGPGAGGGGAHCRWGRALGGTGGEGTLWWSRL